MLTNAQIKLIRSLNTKSGRDESGMCLVEGAKNLELAKNHMEFTFTRKETPGFDKLVSTQTPQDIAGVARIPVWSDADLREQNTIVVLDGVQDPGNVGSILRLCLGFNAGLILVESADVTNPKVIRSSAGAIFQVPWLKIARADASDFVQSLGGRILRLEKQSGAVSITKVKVTGKLIFVAGSEGSGIKLNLEGDSVFIPHESKLESLNVTHALAIALYGRFSNL